MSRLPLVDAKKVRNLFNKDIHCLKKAIEILLTDNVNSIEYYNYQSFEDIRWTNLI
ncbi:MAG: hypothetical protein PWP14_1984 [Methanolobus sp.]|nr:hypothetical protein [Methanolobus sp.]